MNRQPERPYEGKGSSEVRTSKGTGCRPGGSCPKPRSCSRTIPDPFSTRPKWDPAVPELES